MVEVITPQAMPVEWAQAMTNLGNAYTNRIHGERAENIEQAIKCCLEALEVITPQALPVQWAATMNNLGNAYTNRIHGERADNLEQAIKCHRQALTVRTQQALPVEWAQSMTNLGGTYRKRIRGERADNLEQAINCYQQALTVTTKQALPIEWAQNMNNLGYAYFERLRGEQADNLERAINCYEQALEVTTPQALPVKWAAIMNNLGLAYSERLRGEQADNLERAINYYQQALEVHTQEALPVEWALTTMNLGTAYIKRAPLLADNERADNLEQAIKWYEQTLTVRTQEAQPVEWAQTITNLGSAYWERIHGDRADNLERAIAIYQKALKIQTQTALPNEHRQTQHNLGHLYFQERRWADAQRAYAAALAAGNLLYQTSGTTEARQLELRVVRDLPVRAAYCLAKLGRFDEAVETLEQGKARALAEALTRQDAVLERARVLDQTAFTAARERIRELEAEARAIGESGVRDFLRVSANLRQVRDELSAIVARIREYVPEFMPEGLEWAAIKSVAEALSQPLVYLLTTLHGSLALIVPPSHRLDVSKTCDLSVVWLDDFQWDEKPQTVYDQDGKPLHSTGQVNTEAQIKAFKQFLDQIWPRLDEFMLPIATRLSELGYQQAVLIRTGTFSLSPLHAFVPQINLTVAPSARALQTAKGKLSEHAPYALLGIGNPLPNPKPLPFARLEVEAISPLFDTAHTFYEKKATREAVASHVRGGTHLHFSCHGKFNLQQPLDSALSLAGSDTLTLRDLLDGGLDLSAARLAVLSACETGITEFQNVPDEAIGFPAGFLQAGVPGVISTLWPVTDISTALLLVRFYRYHITDGLAPAIALHKAQKWLREATSSQLADYYKQRYQKARRREEEREALRWMRYYQALPDTKPFAHPYYWAAFVFSGV